MEPKSKIMWAILHKPSGSWQGGDTNLLLYWAEHEARLECQRYGGGLKVCEPIEVEVRVRHGKS